MSTKNIRLWRQNGEPAIDLCDQLGQRAPGSVARSKTRVHVVFYLPDNTLFSHKYPQHIKAPFGEFRYFEFKKKHIWEKK